MTPPEKITLPGKKPQSLTAGATVAEVAWWNNDSGDNRTSGLPLNDKV